MSRSIAVLLCTLFVWFCAAQASASPAPSPSPSASPRSKPLDTVVVTAQRHPGTIGATSRETWVLDAKDLDRLGVSSVADALRFVPGITVKDAGTAGSLQSVFLRGASSTQTLVLVDGRPINDPDTGQVDFSSLPVAGISRIEIVEGGASTLYGSSAIGGVINIITQRPSSPAASAFGQAGFEGRVDQGIDASGGDARSIAYAFDARSTHARDEFDYPAFGSLPAGTRSNSDADLQDESVALTHDAGSVSTRLHLSDDAQSIGIPGDLSFQSTPLARQQRIYERSDLTLEAPAGRSAWTLQLFADGRRQHIGDPDLPFPYDALDDAVSRGFALSDSMQASASQIVTFGYDSHGDRAYFGSGVGQPSVPASDSTTAIFAADDMHAANSPFSASVGLREERPQGTKHTGVPSVGILEKLSGALTLRANYARAFRTPDLDDRYFPFAGNPALQPEYAATFDAGLSASNDGGSYSLTWFGADTNNLIVFDPITFLPINVSRASVRGLNGAVALQAADDWHVRFGYTDYPRAADLGGAPNIRLLYRPTATGSADIERDLRSGSTGLNISFTGRRYANETNTIVLPGYASVGAFIERPIGRGLGLTLRADNLTGERVQDTYGYPVLGTTFSVRLTAAQP
ncbi:MAG TPA: TonB-dependent receptor [Candidatus Eremiobacteraceae bacterium]|nr:TonB-dependent receptor [Candidatus Eremiobacteraceae bacterium]